MANETILVVDDSVDMVRFLQDILTPQGYHVISAGDGKSGLQTAVSARPDLIMLDMSMPRMTGIEMLRALRKTECQAPVIFMTMHGSESVAIEAFRLGVRDYLPKPFSLEDAQKAVDHALVETRLTREKQELARNLLAAETVRQTVVTLSHYINNDLMVVAGGMTLIQETLQEELATQPMLARVVRDCDTRVIHIGAVMRVLQRVTEVKETAYLGATRMIDIEAALKEEMARRDKRLWR